MKIMIYERYLNFLKSIVQKSEKHNWKFLLNFVKDDVRSQTGGNIKKISLDTERRIIPGVTDKFSMAGVEVYKVEDDEQWRVPMIHSLCEIRNDQWEIRFCDNDSNESVEGFKEDDIEDMLYDICTS